MLAYRRIAATYSISLLVEVVNRLAPLVVIHFVTAKIGVSGFGYAQIGMQMIDVAIYFVMAGFHISGAIDVGNAAKDPKKISSIISEVVTLKLIHAAVAFALLMATVSFVPSYQQFYPIVLPLSFLLLTTAIDLSFVNTGTQRVFVTSLVTLICRVLSLVAVLMLVQDHDDAILYALLSFGANAVVSIIIVLLNHRYFHWTKPSKQSLYRRFKVALPFAITAILMTLIDRFDLFAADMVGGTELAGLYAVPARLSFSILLIMHVIANVFFSELVSAKSDEVFKKYIELTIFSLSILYVPIVFGVWFVDAKLINLIAGEAFVGDSPILSILLLASIPQIFIMVCGHLILQVKRQSTVYNWLILTALILGVLVSAPLGRSYSGLGIAAAMLMAKTIMAMAIYYFARPYLGSFNVLRFGKIIFASAVMAAGLYFYPMESIWLQLMFAIALYSTALLLVAFQDLAALKTKLKPSSR